MLLSHYYPNLIDKSYLGFEKFFRRRWGISSEEQLESPECKLPDPLFLNPHVFFLLLEIIIHFVYLSLNTEKPSNIKVILLIVYNILSDNAEKRVESLQQELIEVQLKYQKEIERLEKDNKELKKQILLNKSSKIKHKQIKVFMFH